MSTDVATIPGEVFLSLGSDAVAATVTGMNVVAALGWLCTILSAVALLPQLWRALRQGVDGVCPDTLALTAMSSAWWTWYSAAIWNGPSMVSSALGFVVPAATLVVVLRKSSLTFRTAVGTAAGLVVLVPVGLWSPTAVAALATGFGLIRAIPQAWRCVTDSDLSGVSLPAWLLTLVGSVVWPIYALAVAAPLLGASSLATLPCAVVVCWRVLRNRAAVATAESVTLPAVTTTVVAAVGVAERTASPTTVLVEA